MDGGTACPHQVPFHFGKSSGIDPHIKELSTKGTEGEKIANLPIGLLPGSGVRDIVDVNRVAGNGHLGASPFLEWCRQTIGPSIDNESIGGRVNSHRQTHSVPYLALDRDIHVQMVQFEENGGLSQVNGGVECVLEGSSGKVYLGNKEIGVLWMISVLVCWYGVPFPDRDSFDVGNVGLGDGNGCVKENAISQISASSVKVFSVALAIAVLNAFGNGIDSAVATTLAGAQKDPLAILLCFVGAVGVGAVSRTNVMGLSKYCVVGEEMRSCLIPVGSSFPVSRLAGVVDTIFNGFGSWFDDWSWRGCCRQRSSPWYRYYVFSGEAIKGCFSDELCLEGKRCRACIHGIVPGRHDAVAVAVFDAEDVPLSFVQADLC